MLFTISPKLYFGGSESWIGVSSVAGTLSVGGNVASGAGFLFLMLLDMIFINSSAFAPKGLPCQFSSSSIPWGESRY